MLGAAHKAPEGEGSQGQLSLLAPFYPLISVCISPGFTSIQVNKNHLPALHRAAQEGSPLVYVYVRQSALDCALIPLVLFCHSLSVPYTVCPLNIKSSFLRSVLQKVGVVLLPPSTSTELEAEMDPLYATVMTS
ncbi:hypothetical protein ILYODFUR_009696, partial [Ilyodon furcidens]